MNEQKKSTSKQGKPNEKGTMFVRDAERSDGGPIVTDLDSHGSIIELEQLCFVLAGHGFSDSLNVLLHEKKD